MSYMFPTNGPYCTCERAALTMDFPPILPTPSPLSPFLPPRPIGPLKLRSLSPCKPTPRTTLRRRGLDACSTEA